MSSLKEISTGYTVFEKDQVLTHLQLNSVADYLDDEGRLTRVCLLGVGVVCGLRPSLQSNIVTVTKGAGVTTDGDLLRLPADTIYDKFKAYDETAPAYPPLYVNDQMITAFELIPQSVSDQAATPLSSFGADTGQSLDKMVAVFLMESYLKDEDLCSGTDCDNLGKDSINTPRLLIIDQSSAGTLAEKIATPADAYKALQDVVADRPTISAAINSASSLALTYRATCDSINKKISAELAKVFTAAGAFLGDVLPSNPTTTWINRLNAINASFAASDTGIQYYYDFLKDLVETYNDFRGVLFAEKTVCCPEVTAFPKHLLLGNLGPGASPDQNRTGFYPSPATNVTRELGRAKFLVAKLDTLISTFQIPAGVVPIRITPSATEETCLEERAIPYYYQVNTSKPIQRSWNYRLSTRSMEAFNYSYNASLYAAQGGAANPFGSQIGRFSFFRIEGHIGREVSGAQRLIEDEIRRANLPIAVEAVMAGSNRDKTVKPPFRYTDLHRLHHLVRNDVSHQLNEVTQFSAVFKSQIDDAVDKGVVRNTSPGNDGPAVKKTAEDRHKAVTTSTLLAKTKLNKDYSAYQQDNSWTSDLSNALEAAGQFKEDLGSVVKTDFSTPFDSAIANRNLLWLEWLDQLIGDKQKTEDEKLLLSTFIAQHPGLEHFGGATRGGTFVLVYDENKIVVGDTMLPYTCCAVPEPEPPQAVFEPPKSKPDSTVIKGIRIIPSLDKFVDDKLAPFKLPTTPPVNLDFDRKFDDILKSMVNIRTSLDVFSKSFDRVAGGGVNVPGAPVIDDAFLSIQVRDIFTKRQKVELLRDQLLQPNLPAEAAKLTESQLKAAEADLAKTFEGTTRYISTSKMDVSKGSSGFEAMSTLFSTLGSLKEASALKTARAGLKKVGTETAVPELKVMITNILK